MTIDADCIQHVDLNLARLQAIEAQLAERLGLIPNFNIREQLVVLDLGGQLIEDELVADWHEAYSSYLDDIREEKERITLDEIECLVRVRTKMDWAAAIELMRLRRGGYSEGRLPSNIWEVLVLSGFIHRLVAQTNLPITTFADVDPEGNVTQIKWELR